MTRKYCKKYTIINKILKFFKAGITGYCEGCYRDCIQGRNCDCSDTPVPSKEELDREALKALERNSNYHYDGLDGKNH